MSLRRWLLALSPLLFFGALIAWTVAVYPYSKYGDDWATDPAKISFPIFILWNILLVFFWWGGRMHLNYAIVGIAYVFFVSVLYLMVLAICGMMITKDYI